MAPAGVEERDDEKTMKSAGNVLTAQVRGCDESALTIEFGYSAKAVRISVGGMGISRRRYIHTRYASVRSNRDHTAPFPELERPCNEIAPRWGEFS